jgi:hypothetical protein
MRHITTTIYTYAELSDGAKERARDWYRGASAGDGFFAEYVLDDAAEIADIMGVDLRQTPTKDISGETSRYKPSISYSGFSSQGDGASFKGYYKYKKGACKALKAYAPKDEELQRICKTLQDAQKKVFYSATCNIFQRGHYCHSGTMQIELDCKDNVSSELFDETEEAILQALRDFADWIYRQLESQYDYENSDSAIVESIEANCYEFNENGTIA